jgi:photoactive yellow protein
VDEYKEESSIIPFGLLELDEQGTVVHYSPATQWKRRGRDSDNIIGRNFFDDVIPVLPVKEFKERFLRFMALGDSVQRFTIRCPFEQRDIRVQIILARITERTERNSERLALVRLMPETFVSYPASAVA